ncbi:hypothetical protein EDB89DRAFT_2001710 [Lactarius sanguifluus]|nr:hypothetical protein EDB89DRAFT_2001710 [Lactarius sanguifluus]
MLKISWENLHLFPLPLFPCPFSSRDCPGYMCHLGIRTPVCVSQVVQSSLNRPQCPSPPLSGSFVQVHVRLPLSGVTTVSPSLHSHSTSSPASLASSASHRPHLVPHLTPMRPLSSASAPVPIPYLVVLVWSFVFVLPLRTLLPRFRVSIVSYSVLSLSPMPPSIPHCLPPHSTQT